MTPEDELERQDDIAVAAEYVLGLLTPAEVAAFEARLAVDPEFRVLVARWSEDFAGLARAIPAAEPPRGAEARLMKRLFPEEEGGWLHRLGLVPAILGGLVAALLVFVATNLDWLRCGQGAVAELRSQNGTLVLAAAYDPGTGMLRIAREGPPPRPGRAEELWLIAPEAAPVSLGLLPPAGEGEIALDPTLLPLPAGAALAVSDEPPGGSPTGAPTGEMLAAGSIADA